MLTLIKREIQDHIVYFFGAAIFTTILIIITVFAVYDMGRDSVIYTGFSLPVIVVVMIGFSSMGVLQMYTDRTRKISAFLTTLPVSRNKILLARIITGILAILILILPLIITSMALLYLYAPPIQQINSSITLDIFVVVFLIGFACYCLGLMTGWTTGKIAPVMAFLVLTFILSSLILVKGFGPYAKGIIILFIVTCLIRTWQKFTSTSL